MNHTTAQCGCLVIAEGAPGSMVRCAQESRHCGKPRCRSQLPTKFNDDEVEAWCYLHDTGTAFNVDFKTRGVLMIVNRLGMEMYFPTLAKAAEYRKQQVPEKVV